MYTLCAEKDWKYRVTNQLLGIIIRYVLYTTVTTYVDLFTKPAMNGLACTITAPHVSE